MSRTKQRKKQTVRPPYILAAAGALLLLVAVGWSVWPRHEPPPVAVDSSAAGRLVASEPAIDLGRVPFDRTVEARYELTNTGSTPVRLVSQPRVKMLEGC